MLQREPAKLDPHHPHRELRRLLQLLALRRSTSPGCPLQLQPAAVAVPVLSGGELMKPFRERNPLPIGIAGVLGDRSCCCCSPLNAASCRSSLSGHTVYAEFTDAASLQKGNNVRVAGVLVGKVTSVKLDYSPAGQRRRASA